MFNHVPTSLSSQTTPKTAGQTAHSRLLLSGLLGALMLTTAGCASRLGANDINRGAVGQASTVRQGTVTSAREVTIRNENGVGNQIATGAGAAIGGLLGSQVGGRRSTRAIGSIGGVVAGGLAGNAIGNAANTTRGYAYVVRFDNGESREIVQGADIYIQPGTPVNVVFRPDRAVIQPAS